MELGCIPENACTVTGGIEAEESRGSKRGTGTEGKVCDIGNDAL